MLSEGRFCNVARLTRSRQGEEQTSGNSVPAAETRLPPLRPAVWLITPGGSKETGFLETKQPASSDMDWAPLPDAAFRSVQANQKSSSVVRQCDQQGCSASTCRLFRGCLLVTAQSLTPNSVAADVATEWLSLADLSRFQRLSLMHAAATMDRHTHTMIAVWIPSHLLADLLLDQYLPEVGLVGWAQISNTDVAKGFARYGYR
eukprot:gene20963-27818_t